jgi:penicillin-binding protein 2
MVPRRNPEIAVVVLQEHGDWGSGSAKLAAQVITAYVNKKRRQDHNLLLQADKKTAPVEMGAVWSTPAPSEHPNRPRNAGKTANSSKQLAGMSGGHFFLPVDPDADATADALKLQAPLFPIHVPGKPIAPEDPEKPTGASIAGADLAAVLPERFRGVIRHGAR